MMPKLQRIDNNQQEPQTAEFLRGKNSSANNSIDITDFKDTLSETEHPWLQIREDKSRVVTLSDGTICVFRSTTVKDIRELRNAGITDEFESTIRIAARTCIQWGDKPGITPVQLDNLELADFMRISEALKSFLPQ